MIKSYKVMLIPNRKQKSKLFKYANVARFAYNWAIAKERESLDNGNGFIPDKELRKEFTVLKHTKGYEWLLEVSNNVTKQAIKDACKAYLRYFKMIKKPGYKPYTEKQIAKSKRTGKSLTKCDRQGCPKFKSKHRSTPSFYQDVVKIQFTDSHVKVEGFSSSRKSNKQKLNWIKLAEKDRIPQDTKYLNPRITFDGINWWISVGVEVENTENFKFKKEELNDNSIGIDLGVKTFATCSDNVNYKNINKSKTIKKLEKRKRRLQRSISRKYEKSNKKGAYCKTKNIVKQEKALLKTNHRLTNLRQNHTNQTIIDIINRKPRFICIEDLNVKGMMKNKHLSKSVQDCNFASFRSKLTNKCEIKGIELIIADRWYPSSKLCSCCGNIKKDLKLSDRTYKCNICGNIIDRDYQASINLLRYGEKIYELAK